MTASIVLLFRFAATWNFRCATSRNYYNVNCWMLSQIPGIGVKVMLVGGGLLAAACAQTERPEPKNPLARNPDAVRAGRGLYLKRCAVCHGQDAAGSMAASLVRSRTVTRGSDAALFQVISEGFPGTQMPPQTDLEPQKIWQLVAYLHNLARPGLQPPLSGDAEAGRNIFESAGCVGCHQVEGKGGFLGPSLDSIAARKPSNRIRTDVLDPDTEVSEGYRTVAVVTRGGVHFEGFLKNEDTFSVQILTRGGRFRMFDRREIAQLRKPSQSAMPRDYRSRLSDEQLQNLLAYLDRLRDPHIPVQRGFRNY